MPGGAVSSGFDLAAQALLSESITAGISMSYTSAHYTETVTHNGLPPIVHDGDAVGTPPQVTSPWNVVASLEQRLSLRDYIVTLRAEDIFHSRNPGPFYTMDPGSPYYDPSLRSDPSTNLLNLRATFDRANFSTALFVNNLLDSQPTLLQRNKSLDQSTLFYATTFRPRTVGLSGTWRF